MKSTSSVAALLLLASMATAMAHPQPQQQQQMPPGFRLTNSRVLDSGKGGKVRLSWGSNEADPSTLYFQVEAAVHGWVGIGFNSRAAMGGADMALGWVDANGTPFFEDRHGVADFEAPKKDTVNNLNLLMAYENATHTVFRWSRSADTKDPNGQDFVLTSAPVEVLWAYTEADPENNLKAGYHDQKRGNVKMSVMNGAAANGNNGKNNNRRRGSAQKRANGNGSVSATRNQQQKPAVQPPKPKTRPQIRRQ